MRIATLATDAVAPPTPSPAEAARRDVLTVTASVAPFGVVVGVASAAAGLPLAAAVAGAAAVYGGSAQLATTTTLAGGASVASAVAAGLVVSARLVLYATALEPRFRGQPWWFRLVGPQAVVDQTFLAADAHRGAPAEWFRRYWLRLGLLLLVVWAGAVAVGVVVGPLLPPLPHLGLVGPALFTCLLVPRLVTAPAVAAAAAGGAVALLASWLVPGQGVLAGAAAGVVAGAVAERRRS